MDHNARVRKRIALTRRAAGQEHGSHGSSLTHADRGNIALDVVHRVVDRETRSDNAARRIDIERNILIRISRFKVQKLRNDRVSDRIVDLFSQEDDALVEQTRIDVVAAFAAGRLLDNIRDECGLIRM